MIEQAFKMVLKYLSGIWLFIGIILIILAIALWYYLGLKTKDERKIAKQRFSMIALLFLMFSIPFFYCNYCKNSPKDQQLNYIIFEDSLNYNRWIKEVEFELGLPRYSRKLKSDKIYQDQKFNKIVHMRTHPDSNEKRVFCNIRKQIPDLLLSKDAETEYRFVKANHLDLEEIGFINDSYTSKNKIIFYSNIPDIDDSKTFSESFEPNIDSSQERYMEFNSYFIAELRRNDVNRNSYIMDYGSSYKKNRISIYIGQNDTLFYRIIDNLGKAYIVSMSHNLFGKKYQYFFRYRLQNNLSIIEVIINGKSIFKKSFNYMIPFNGNGNRIYSASNIDGAYCSNLLLFYYNMHVIINGTKTNLMNLNIQNLDSLLITKDMINIMLQDGKEINLNNIEEDDIEAIKVR